MFFVTLIFLAITGRTLGLRELYVQTLICIFEWGTAVSGEDEFVVDEDDADGKPIRTKKRHSSGDLGIIRREKTDIIDEKLHSTEEPLEKQTTVSVVVDDTLDFITAGIESIIEDQVTSRFAAAQLPSWNLLTRTRYSFLHLSWKLTFLWLAGFLVRYLILVPCRIVLFMISVCLMLVLTSIIGHIPNQKLRKWLNRHAMLMAMRIFSRAFSSIIRYHDRENRAMHGGICVANHTSPIDVMILSCDNCYAMIGQRQPGFLGFLQHTLSKAEHHIWFERSEAADRKKVTQRLREHVEDESKLPIIIFPEGTCINNTSVMMFKKGSFEIGSTIYPIAVKYDSRLTDAFWNSSEQSYGEYLWRMMTSWCIICDVWYLPPMIKMEGEDAIAFARRVKRAIAKKGGLVDLEWDGALKRERVSSKLISLQQKLYYDRLARTTTLGKYTEEEQTELLDAMQKISQDERDKLLKEIDESDDDEEIIRKISVIKDTSISDRSLDSIPENPTSTVQSLYSLFITKLNYDRTTSRFYDQLKLPHTLEYIEVHNSDDAVRVIKNMNVRGAPLIANVGAFGILFDSENSHFTEVDDYKNYLLEKISKVANSRPTAVNLHNILKRLTEIITNGKYIGDIKDCLRGTIAGLYHDEREENRRLVWNGYNEIISRPAKDQSDRYTVITICNTGSLATVSWGTALGVIRALHEHDKLLQVFALETRPYNQGIRLTASELQHGEVPFKVITDSMAAYAMSKFAIDAILVGADRVAMNGDTANKIGTYMLAVSASYHRIPFYPVVPVSSIDKSISSGSEIVIEERPEDELLFVNGQRIAPLNVRAWNPAFDVTPSNLITKIITEVGNFEPKDLHTVFRN
ncbi:hypothetical protein WR25_20382 [Diploscapter pachys]|uniref:Methylthioribose-1-phosphate isomerase n=1 Tax=Diploscapter pachys TaxID=2018661 RepID=A0A2A2J660_9BILA|nr:hypothetical protein WR25_20382 [Diploscapter pachys]